MKQTQQPLYPKLSSIYNKILQLASAILLIVALMSMWQSTSVKNRLDLAEHFDYIAKQQLQQGVVGTAVILQQTYKSKAEQKQILQAYINGLSRVDFVKQVLLYDVTGALIVASKKAHKDAITNKEQSSESINDLYGISLQQRDLSTRYIPFVAEVRDESSLKKSLATRELFGYLRFTIEKSYLTDILAKADDDQQALFRLMLLLAGLVGFLLTRGLNRFSRRGYRINKARKPLVENTLTAEPEPKQVSDEIVANSDDGKSY
jgi:membrane protein